jgi:hypothetical protein
MIWLFLPPATTELVDKRKVFWLSAPWKFPFGSGVPPPPDPMAVMVRVWPSRVSVTPAPAAKVTSSRRPLSERTTVPLAIFGAVIARSATEVLLIAPMASFSEVTAPGASARASTPPSATVPATRA